MNKRIIFICLTILASFKLSAQSAYWPTTSPVFPLAERMEIKSGSLRNGLYLDIKPFRRDEADSFFKKSDTSVRLTKADKWWLRYYKSDNLPHSSDSFFDSRKPILKYFYRSKANLYQVNTDGLDLFVNPVLAFEGGWEVGEGLRYRNTRGVEVRGIIDDKVGFYTYLTENQVVYNDYLQRYQENFGVVPGEGYWKHFKKNGYDFFNTRAYITFAATKHINFQFGNDRNKIGDGYRSLLLSDFAKDYLNLKVNAKVWRFQYQMIFAQFTDYHTNQIKPYPRKFGAMHYLTLDVLKRWNVGLFEGVIFHDNKKDGRGFELSYLNPVIFYRAVEHSLGSPDNAMVGGNTSVIIGRSVKLYGQLLLDEFVLGELKKDRGWMHNKYGLQGGVKYMDVFGLPNVDLQAEYNYVRPFTYTSDTSAKNYAHFRQSLAHPRGANFTEAIGILRVNTYAPLDITVKAHYILQGLDSNWKSLGSDITKNYLERSMNHPYGNSMLQGVLSKTLLAELKISYMVRHNLFLDLKFIYRDERTAFFSEKTRYAGLGLRYNFIPQTVDF